MNYNFLNTDYVAKVYDSYNFNFDDNYDNTLANLSKSGSLSVMKRHQLDILRYELDDYFGEFGKNLIHDDMIEECHIMLNEIIDDVEYDMPI